MSKCIICGRELTTSEPIEMYNGMCAKCHIEQNFTEYLFKQGINDYQQQIAQLIKQLTEKDNLIEFGRKEIRKRNRRIDEIVERDKKLFEDKNKEIESLNKRVDRYENMFRSRIARTGDMQKDIELCIKQLAIQELEKVKVNLKDRITMMSNEEHSYLQKVVIWYDICNQVNKQIKELKGEKDIED